MAARPVWSWLCLLLLSQCRVLLALEVTPGSTCAALCLNNPESDPLNPASSSTSPSDITCSDEGYSETSVGIKFKNCLDCLRDSRDTKNGESDLSWFLYNLRYSVNVCLYGYPNVTTNPISSPCDINYACEPLKTSLRAGNLVPNNGSQLDYCDADGARIKSTRRTVSTPGGEGIADSFWVKWLITNDEQSWSHSGAGCDQRPKSGDLLGLSGDLFANAAVTISEPPVKESDLKDDPSPTGMTTGAIVGIAVGAALLFLGGSALFFVYYRKQKKLYGEELNSEYDGYSRKGAGSQQAMMRGPGGHSIFDHTGYAASNYELRAQSQQQHQAGFGKNADYYDEIEKEMQMQGFTARVPNYNFDPHSHMRGPNGALPTHPAYIPKSLNRSRESTPEPPRLPSQASHHHHHQPDAYATNPYLNAAPAHAQPPVLSIPASSLQAHHHRRTSSIPPPPPGPPPSQQQQHHQHQPQQPAPSNSNVNGNDNSVLAAARRSILLPSGAAPPPPPPPRAPRLTLPSVRKLRVPKKYAPPQITIEEPTPVSSPAGGEVPIGLDISNPLPHHLQRFADDQHPGLTTERSGSSSSAGSQQQGTTTTILSMPDHGGIRQQHAVDRRQRNNGSDAEYVEIYTSKSDIYG
ncbi:hypothetical protein PG993_011274 [Apiospora rasikravindrae]|uniref:Uncharacterized protein n=1 Tax=Apiospora rasikravindrae TaxID=990691 RepID=A0ABR1SFC6_9PEZI